MRGKAVPPPQRTAETGDAGYSAEPLAPTPPPPARQREEAYGEEGALPPSRRRHEEGGDRDRFDDDEEDEHRQETSGKRRLEGVTDEYSVDMGEWFRYAKAHWAPWWAP